MMRVAPTPSVESGHGPTRVPSRLGRNQLDLAPFEGATLTPESVLAAAPESLAGQRVALVGSAFGLADVARTLRRRGNEVVIFDPVLQWVLPPEARAIPRAYQRRAAKLYLRAMVPDAWLRDRMTPRGVAAEQPPLFEQGFHALFTRHGCDLVSWPLAAVRHNGLLTADGIVTRVDVVVYDDSLART